MNLIVGDNIHSSAKPYSNLMHQLIGIDICQHLDVALFEDLQQTPQK